MSQKRLPDDSKARADGGTSDDKSRKVPRLRSVVNEVMRIRSVQLALEPLIRRVVKEEVDLALRKHLNSMKRNCGKEVHPSELRSLQLKFLNSLSLPVFTGARIEGEGCLPIKIALVDDLSGKIVALGPESSAKVEIVVLEGDFDGDEGNNWTTEEFKNNIVREREGKKPLLTGDVLLILKDGTGVVGEISFTDNSSWTRSRRFRLGARVVDNYDGVRIKEAKSEPFVVRDHRGELYKKHHPPSLFDEVWRLEKIGKDGAFHKRLSREKIYTVKDFLTLLTLDSSRLRNILGTGMSAKMWEVTVEHARTCILDKRVYVYYQPGSQQKTGVVFNVVGQLMGLLSDCQYVSMDKLSETDKVDAQNMIISAFQHWEDVVSFDDEASLTGGSSHTNNVDYTPSSSRMETSNSSKVSAPHKIDQFDYREPTSPDIMSSLYSIGDLSSLELDDYALHAMDNIGIDNMDISYDQTLNYPVQVSNSLVCDTASMTQSFNGEHLQYFDPGNAIQSRNPTFGSPADLQCAVDSFLCVQSTVRKTGKAQCRWTGVLSALKFFIWMKKVRIRSRGRGIQQCSH